MANVAVAIAGLAVLVGGAAVWAGFSQFLEARGRLFDRLAPALIESQRLRSSLVDQETGARGYIVTFDRRLLAPYLDGEAEQERIDGELRELLGPLEHGDELLAMLDDVNAAMDLWRSEVTDTFLETFEDDQRLDLVFVASTELFDQVRVEMQQFEDAVAAERLEAREGMDEATTQLVVIVGAAMALLAFVALAGSWLLRRRVVRPIRQLVVAADGVVLDRLDQPIEVDGPSEIHHLAVQVGLMRDRIVSELAEVERRKAELDEQAEDLRRSNQDLEQFAYVASHDLQEPLRKVASFCQLLEQRYGDQLDERGQSYIDFAVDGAKRMQALISDLLDFSRVGRTTEHFVEVDLDQIGRDVVERYTEVVPDATISADPLPVVQGDPLLYGALIQNLVGNAVKYRRPDVHLQVHVSAERVGDEWRFRCVDNGIGIEPRFRERVFVIFQRLHGREAFEGTGIGLAMCKKIVEFSGGRIWIDEPVDDVGTVVCWTLPALGATPIAPPPPPRKRSCPLMTTPAPPSSTSP